MISYQDLLDDAMLGIVRKVLINVENHGLEDDHSFYISFRTDHPDVIISKHVKAKYPKEITIVLQYQFKNLHVFEDKFTVNIAFGGIPETIIVPFDSLTSFVDPLENFSLQFRRVYANEIDEEDDIDGIDDIDDIDDISLMSLLNGQPKQEEKRPRKAGEVIAIDKYRKRKK